MQVNGTEVAWQCECGCKRLIYLNNSRACAYEVIGVNNGKFELEPVKYPYCKHSIQCSDCGKTFIAPGIEEGNNDLPIDSETVLGLFAAQYQTKRSEMRLFRRTAQ